MASDPGATHTEARDWLARELRRHGLTREAATAILAAADTYAARAAAHAKDGERERIEAERARHTEMAMRQATEFLDGQP